MSADRYEILDDGALTIAIKLGENTQYVDELEDDFVVGAIRQQAHDIAELEVFAEIGRQWNADSLLAKWFPLTAERVEQDAQELVRLRADLAAAVAIIAARDETIAELELRLRISRQSNKELREAAERAEARLAAIDGAPTVAVAIEVNREVPNGPHRTLVYCWDELPPHGTELIARPAKESK